jgi:tetratricopeptide (TPR) repeat protein
MGIPYQRGMLLYQQKRYAMAADEFRTELSQKPGSALAMSMLALSMTYDGRMALALPEAQAAIAADPERAFCHYALACTMIGPAPRFTKGQVLLGTFGKLGQYRRRLRKATPAAMEALRLDPINPEYLALMSAIHLDLKSPKKALQWADKGLAARPDHVRSANLRAKALTKLGRIKEARQTLQGALAVNPEDASTHATSGWTLLKGGDSKKAVKHFSESLRLNPLDENTRRGLSLAKAGKKAVWPGLIVGIGIAASHLTSFATTASPQSGLMIWVILIAAFVWLVLMVSRRHRSK